MTWSRLLRSWHAMMDLIRRRGDPRQRAAGPADRRQRRREQLVQQLEELARADLRRDHALPAEDPPAPAKTRGSDTTGWLA